MSSEQVGTRVLKGKKAMARREFWSGRQRQASIGMTLAFHPCASERLADIPAQVVEVWPRFRSGDYLVTLEYAKPITYKNETVIRIEAFMSELYQPDGQNRSSHR